MKRFTSLLLVVLVAVTLTSCDFAKVNAKCKVGSPLARDNTHVLRCDGGRWKRFVTVQQAAQFILGQLPGSVALEGTAPAVIGKESFKISFKVTTRNGGPAAGEKVTVSGPATGPSITAETTAIADTSGIATLDLTANGTLGAFDLTAKAGEASTKVSLTSTVGPAASIALLAGNAPVAHNALSTLIARVSDKNGFFVPNAKVTVVAQNATAVTPSIVTDANGIATGQVLAPPGIGVTPFGVTMTVDGTSVQLSFQGLAV